MSIEAAAKISASYSVASGSMELSVKQKEAMESFNSSSETSVATKGGDPRYGNEDFLKNVEAWAASIVDYPEFVDFRSLPCFTSIYEFATTTERRGVLENAYTEFEKQYANSLALPGPYLKARLTKNIDMARVAYLKVENIESDISLGFVPDRSDG
ncbi:hypothetical protein BC835DRAFT_1317756 [Cytidiella melzeri]|nr:hypothetical protein BC835DRAFT_1317756 [Cytidiella melzeri]